MDEVSEYQKEIYRGTVRENMPDETVADYIRGISADAANSFCS